MLIKGRVWLFGDDIDEDHQHDPHQHPWNRSAQKEPSDGDGGNRAIDNKGDAGRDDRADRGGGAYDRRGKGNAIAGLFHGRDENGAGARGVRHA